MPIRPIVRYGHPALHAPSAAVETIDGPIVTLVEDMVATMYAAPGIGLAAPQVAVPLRVIVIDLSVGEDPRQLIKLVNPEFLDREGEQKHEEGCLSIPGYMGDVERHVSVTVKGLNRRGKPFQLKARDWTARIFQHEIDHLDGVLFIDRAESVWRLEAKSDQVAPAE